MNSPEVRASQRSGFAVSVGDVKLGRAAGHESPTRQHGHERIIRNTIKGTRKNVTIDSTKNISLHRPNKERKYKNKLSPAGTTKMKKTKMLTTEVQMKKLQRVAVQTQIATKTATFPCMKDTDEEIFTSKIEEEDWTEYRKRSTATAVEKTKAAKIPCWIDTHRRLKWRLAMRIASLPDERWEKKAAKMEPRPQHQAPDKQTSGKTKKRNRKMK